MKQKREHLAIDSEKCSGCRLCELACSMKHHAVCDPKLARIRIARTETPPQNIPIVCMACEDAPCIKVCPMNARIRETNGAVLTDDERCIGCRACIYICPIASPTVNPCTGQTMTCDMCMGEESPWCVSACRFEGALRMVEPGILNSGKIRRQAERIRSVSERRIR